MLRAPMTSIRRPLEFRHSGGSHWDVVYIVPIADELGCSLH